MSEHPERGECAKPTTFDPSPEGKARADNKAKAMIEAVLALDPLPSAEFLKGAIMGSIAREHNDWAHPDQVEECGRMHAERNADKPVYSEGWTFGYRFVERWQPNACEPAVAATNEAGGCT